MTEAKRLRIFAGPNGSGKSTLFADISSRYSAGYFVNSDNIEGDLSKTKFLKLEDFGLFTQYSTAFFLHFLRL